VVAILGLGRIQALEIGNEADLYGTTPSYNGFELGLPMWRIDGADNVT